MITGIKPLPTSDNPLVSIALCTYNGAEFLEEQIQSILRQTYKNYELVIVDDHSTDGTQEVLENLESHTNCRIYYNLQNEGVVANFEKAIKYCHGELIALSDQDDLWEPNKIEVMVKSIGDNLLIYHDSQMFYTYVPNLDTKISEQLNFVKGKCSLSLAFRNCISGHAMLFRAQLKDYLLKTPPGISHDWWIAYVAAAVGKIDFINTTLVRYRQHLNSQTDFFKLKPNHKQIKSIEDIVEEKKLRYHINLSSFANYKFNPPENTELLSAFYQAYLEREKNGFSFKLVYLLLSNLNVYDVDDKTLANKIFHAFKEAFDTNTKAIFKYQKLKIQSLFKKVL